MYVCLLEKKREVERERKGERERISEERRETISLCVAHGCNE